MLFRSITFGLQKVYEWLTRNKAEAQRLEEVFSNMNTSQLSGQLDKSVLADAAELDILERRRELVGLNEEEQQKYNGILQKLQQLYPELKTVQDSYGNSVLDTTAHITGATGAVRDFQKALANEGWQAAIKGADEALAKVNSKIEAVASTIRQSQSSNVDNLFNAGRGVDTMLDQTFMPKLEVMFAIDRPSFDRVVKEAGQVPEDVAQIFAEKQHLVTDRIHAGLQTGLYKMGVTLPTELEQILYNPQILQALTMNFTKAGTTAGQEFESALNATLSNISNLNTGGAFSGIAAELEKINNLRKQVADGGIEANTAEREIADIYAHISSELASMLDLQDRKSVV